MEKGYNLNEVASLLGIKPRTVRKWIYDDVIQAQKIVGTGRWVVMESEIKRLRGEQNV